MSSHSGAGREEPVPHPDAISKRELFCSSCGTDLLATSNPRPKLYKTKCGHVLCKSCTLYCRTKEHGTRCKACKHPLDLRNFDLFEVKLYRVPDLDQSLLSYATGFPELIIGKIVPEAFQTVVQQQRDAIARHDDLRRHFEAETGRLRAYRDEIRAEALKLHDEVVHLREKLASAESRLEKMHHEARSMSVGARPAFRDVIGGKFQREGHHQPSMVPDVSDPTALVLVDRAPQRSPSHRASSAQKRRSQSRGLQRYGVQAAFGHGEDRSRGPSVASSGSRRRHLRELAPGPHSVAMQDAVSSVRSAAYGSGAAEGGADRRDHVVGSSGYPARPSTAMVRETIGADVRTGTQLL